MSSPSDMTRAIAAAQVAESIGKDVLAFLDENGLYDAVLEMGMKTFGPDLASTGASFIYGREMNDTRTLTTSVLNISELFLRASSLVLGEKQDTTLNQKFFDAIRKTSEEKRKAASLFFKGRRFETLAHYSSS